MRFAARAEHCNGQSVAHPCQTGIYEDPTDSFQVSIEADSIDEAEQIARRLLQQRVEQSEACDCRRARRAGSDAWWDSVAISLWPQDDESMSAWVAAGGNPESDP